MAEPADGLPGQMGSNGLAQTLTTSEVPVKGRTRQRILRGMHRISSSPSLSVPNHPKSAGGPYRSRSTSSCVRLLAANIYPTTSTNRSPARPSPLSMESDLDEPDPAPDAAFAHAPAHARASAPAPCESLFVDAEEEQEVADALLSVRQLDDEGSETPSVAMESAAMDLTTDSDSSELFHTPGFDFFEGLPQEICILIFSFLSPKELVRTSIVCRYFFTFCFDGQLWKSVDASEFYREIPAASLSNIICAAGPFIRYLNLRGCVQVEHYKRAEILVKSCNNLMHTTLEGCKNFQKRTLHGLLETNERLVYLNLTGLSAVTNAACEILATSCPRLESLNVSWCEKVDASGLKKIVDKCRRLRELDAGEVKGFDSVAMARSIFRTNGLERLVLSGCTDLTDEALGIMMRGVNPQIDILTSHPIVPPRKLRHLDLSRCVRLTSYGVEQIGHVTPELQGLQLSRCKLLMDTALIPILASTPRLTHLELEEMTRLTSSLLSEHLVNAPCAGGLEHLGLSYCDRIGDTGVIPVMKKCVRLKRVDLDNTRISDLALAEAASMVMKRSQRSMDATSRPKKTLYLSIFDCPNVTWAGIREILFRNAQVRPTAKEREQMTYPTEMIGMKVFYGFQLTVNEHAKRVLRGDFAAASRLERKWADYMQESEEAGADGIGFRRRRRRAREAAQTFQMGEEETGVLAPQRSRTMGSCCVM